MRRVLALLAAAAMVVGSIAIRSRWDGDEDGAGAGGGGAGGGSRIVCAAELGRVCDGLRGTAAVTVEPAPVTADRLAGDERPDVGGWVVPAPWPQIVDGRRQQRFLPPLFGDPGTPLARSRLVLVVQRDLSTQLRSRCATVEWKCLGEQAVPGPAKPGHADPRTDAFGTLLLGQAAAAWFGRADLSTLDLDDPEFARWLRALELAVPRTFSGGSVLDEMLGERFVRYNAVGTTEAEAKPVLDASAIRDRVELLYPAPMATADVVLAGTGSGIRRLRDPARRALADAGWQTGDAGLPPTNGLPSPGFLDALRSRVQEIR